MYTLPRTPPSWFFDYRLPIRSNIDHILGDEENLTRIPASLMGEDNSLLPLCLTGDKPELALTIQREDGFYAARACLTLDMAYNNARLICRPETSWIKR